MRIKRLYAVVHDGKRYGAGDELDVQDDVGASWVDGGSAVVVEAMERKPKPKPKPKPKSAGE